MFEAYFYKQLQGPVKFAIERRSRLTEKACPAYACNHCDDTMNSNTIRCEDK